MVDMLLHDEALRDIVFVLLVTAALDTLSGIYGAIKGKTFEWKYLDAFIPDHLFKRLTPIVLALGGAVLLAGSPLGAMMFTTASAAVLAYEAATVKSIVENVTESSPEQGGNVPDAV